MEQNLIQEAPSKATRRDWIGLAVIAIPCLIYSMDLTVLHLAVPQISAEFKPSAAQLLWIVDIYGFMVAGALVTMGTLGDRIGRRKVLLYGAAAFGAASALAAAAPSAEMLILARALQGLAAASLAPSTLSLIRNMFLDDRERTFAIGVWVASFSAGAVIGPLFGGVLLTHFNWHSVFLINVPIMALLLIIGPTLLPEFRDPNAGRMDVASAAQSLVAVLSIVYGMKRIAADGVDVLAAGAILVGLCIGWMFFRRQRRLADPLIDVRLFAVPAFSAALIMNILGLFMIMGMFLFIAQYLQLVVGMSPLTAGLFTAPAGVVFACGSMMAPVLLRYFAPRSVVACVLLISAIGFALLTQISAASNPQSLLFIGMLVFCTGMAPVGAITTDLVMAAAPPERAGAASAISETSFEFGGALGIAVLGSILTVVYRTSMEAALLPGVPTAMHEAASETIGGAIAAAQSLSAPAGRELLVVAHAAYTYAFEVTAAVSTACALLAAIVAGLMLPHFRLEHMAK
ncbi:MFS transporter [Hyphomicrobium sp. NDB2Meth4]|uniref:MFS transporter n=1 Tax=Hyphomicrobium sp. NDB2Meth4 TaxID=1892846 RepID=UPI000931F2CA|nr:MFS transporter [Hyphomicrobium sp. NDB2Meth4]